ncbi:hypothetical protein ACFFKU_11375 [Kineococcus gynurae]|uniref:CspA family cold shock protein n=1 Tax=Kineococcus gynurae TaxID=452979 RepID=A0ABV5LUE8_9ACTN
MSTRGVVRNWDDDEGWGVIDSPETPGGCWVLWAAVATTTPNGFRPGQEVAFTYEQGEQDGYGYRALRAWPWGDRPAQRPGVTVVNDRGGAFTSTLTIGHDTPAAEDADTRPTSSTTWPPPPAPVLGTVTVTVYETGPGANEVRIHSLGTLNEELVDTAIEELQQGRRQLLD